MKSSVSWFHRLLDAGLHLLGAFAAGAGNGDHGKTVEHDGKTLVRSDKKSKPYRSIFGVLAIERHVYSAGAKRRIEWAPVDARLGLPAGEQSYVLEDWMWSMNCVASGGKPTVRVRKTSKSSPR